MLAAAARGFADGDGIAVVHGYADVVDEGGETIIGESGGQDLSGDAFHSLLRSSFGPPVTFVVRREALMQVGFFDVSLRSCEDWDLWLRSPQPAASSGWRPTCAARTAWCPAA